MSAIKKKYRIQLTGPVWRIEGVVGFFVTLDQAMNHIADHESALRLRSHFERHDTHYDRDGYCDNPARGF